MRATLHGMDPSQIRKMRGSRTGIPMILRYQYGLSSYSTHPVSQLVHKSSIVESIQASWFVDSQHWIHPTSDAYFPFPTKALNNRVIYLQHCSESIIRP
ncbi:uncharacterized protein J3R85_013792 [Psidium guajava]|nr:uncharacterized protein J3R85_013792 [Psidium guajava]